jgi:hypothetical protein
MNSRLIQRVTPLAAPRVAFVQSDEISAPHHTSVPTQRGERRCPRRKRSPAAIASGFTIGRLSAPPSMRLLMRTLMLGFACLLPLTALAEDHMASMAPMAMPPHPTLGATATFDTNGRLWVVDAGGGHVRLRYSDDLGKTLSVPINVNAQAEAIYATADNRPKIAIGPHDELYVSWSEMLAKKFTGFVRFSRSLDGGKHFSTPINVHHDRAETTHGFDALAVDGHGRVMVAWIDKRARIATLAEGKPYAGSGIYYSWSNDKGASFVMERKLVDHSCECCRIVLARAPNGEVATFFRSIFGDNIRDHAYGVLPADGAEVHVERATFNQWHIAGCPEQGPGLAIAADGTRHAVWYESKDRPTIWYGQLDPGHPPRHALVVATLGASHADVTAYGKAVWITWNQVDAQGVSLMVRHSIDGGLHFDEARQLATATGAAGSPQWVMRGSQPYVAWNTSDGFRLISVGGNAR